MGQDIQIDVAHIAKLARVELTAAETAAFQQEIAAVLDYVRQLQSLEVDQLEPTAHAVSMHNVYREDVPGTTMSQDEMLANAPQVIDGELIGVPPVIGDDAGGSA